MSILNRYSYELKDNTVNSVVRELNLGISATDLFNWYRVEGQRRLDERNRVIQAVKTKLSDHEIKVLGL